MKVELPVVDNAGGELGWEPEAVKPGLSPRTLRWARALAEALFATDEGAPPSARLDWLEGELADFFGRVNLRSRLLFGSAVLAVTIAAPLLVRRLPPLPRLSLADRIEAVSRLERTPLSLALFLAKAILSICYYEHPDAAASIGWDQRCLEDES